MVKLLVEGKSDLRFLEDLIEVRLDKNKATDFEITEVGGWNNLEKNTPTIKRLNDEGHSVKIIFDADDDYQERRAYIEKFKANNNLNFDIFLLPDNSLSGDLETLLECIANDKHRRVLDCFQQYEDCLKKYEKTYALPIRKSKIYAYVDAFPKTNEQKKELKKENFFYKDSEIWNLDSEALRPLVDFLNRGITPSQP